MFRILDRYVGRQIMISAIFAIVIILIILILGNLFKDILRQLSSRDVSLMFVLKFVGLIVPFALSLAIPFSFLSAILLAFGKMSADSELISMRMAGLSISRICWPVASISLFFTIICAAINLSVSPWAKSELEGMKDTLFNKAKRDPMLLVQDKKVMQEFSGYMIYTGKGDDILENFQMVKYSGSVPEFISLSKTAKLRVDMDTDELIVVMEDANIMVHNQMESAQPGFASNLETGISLAQFKKAEGRIQPENLDLLTLVEMCQDNSHEPKMQSRLWTELSQRLAFSVSCIIFAFIGVPLGITAQRKETTAGFGLSLAIAVIYYFLLNMAMTKQDNPELYPYVLVWVPNVLFFILGIFLFIRVSRK